MMWVINADDYVLWQNLSQQSDSTDFLGGFKPVESQSICFPLVEVFNRLFCSSFPSEVDTCHVSLLVGCLMVKLGIYNILCFGFFFFIYQIVMVAAKCTISC